MTFTLQDLDITRKLHMGVLGGSVMCGALMSDCRFLAAHNVMDYSLLVCVCTEEVTRHCTCT
jgi:hypothetical protein